MMNTERKHTDLPMYLVINPLRHGGQYAYANYYIDLAKHYQLLFPDFYGSNNGNFLRTGCRIAGLYAIATAFTRPL
jgi:hypothetical protein